MSPKNINWQSALKKHNKTNQTDPIFIITTLTRADADILLEQNSHNRKSSDRLIERYMYFMENNEWAVNGETIKVDKNGMLLDGQHRLMALQQTNKKIRFAMALGVDKKYFAITDTGASRSSGDILHIAGFKNGNLNAAAITLMIRFQASESFSIRNDVTPAMILSSMQRWSHMEYYVNSAKAVRGIIHSSLLQFMMYVTMTIDEEKSYLFFSKMATGENLSSTSSILQFRNFHQKLKQQRLRIERRHVLASLILTWNAFYENVPVETVKWEGVNFPLITGLNRKKLFKPSAKNK